MSPQGILEAGIFRTRKLLFLFATFLVRVESGGKASLIIALVHWLVGAGQGARVTNRKPVKGSEHTSLTYKSRESRKALLTQTLTSFTVSRMVTGPRVGAWGGKSRKQGFNDHSSGS